jgi:ribosomal protein L10
MPRSVSVVRNNPRVRHGRAIKREIVATLARAIAGARLVLVVGYQGVNGPKTLELRRTVAQLGGHYHVVKNTLARHALAACDLGELGAFLVGPCAIIVAERDPDRVLCGFERYLEAELPHRLSRKRRQAPNVQFGRGSTPHGDGVRTNENEMGIRAVWLDGRLLSEDEYELVLAAGGVDRLRGSLLGVLQAPFATLLGLLHEPARALCAVLRQRPTDRTDESLRSTRG